MENAKVLIIGLDGATFDVIDPLIKEERLPNLKFLKENGAYGILESTFPPITGSAWMSLATGKNPGKTGVFDFRNRRGDGFELKPISSMDFVRAGTFWDYLSQNGKRVGILNYPMLYPPYEINGFMVGGLGCPEDDCITYPPNLKGKLDEVTGGYEIAIHLFAPKYQDNEALFLKDISRLLRKNEKAIDFLLSETEWDLFMVVISASDFLQHYMWRYWDESYPHHEGSKKFNEYREGFKNIWQNIDRIIGSMIENLDDKTHLFILSDHGAGKCTKFFHVNQWLENEGYLVRRESPRKLINWKVIRSKLKEAKSTVLLEKYLPWLYEKGLKLFGSKGNLSLLDEIDMGKSKAFSLYHSALGQIYINSIDKNLHAPVKSEDEYEGLRDEIIDRLKQTVAESGEANKIEIYKSDGIYQGDMIKYLPDIVFLVDDMECEIINHRFSKDVWLPKPPNHRKNGDHRKEGIFIAYGPYIKHNELEMRHIPDVAPTILYLFEEGIPEDMDGRVIAEIFKEDFVVSHPVRKIHVSHGELSFGGELERNDNEELERKLKGLGYL